MDAFFDSFGQPDIYSTQVIAYNLERLICVNKHEISLYYPDVYVSITFFKNGQSPLIEIMDRKRMIKRPGTRLDFYLSEVDDMIEVINTQFYLEKSAGILSHWKLLDKLSKN